MQDFSEVEPLAAPPVGPPLPIAPSLAISDMPNAPVRPPLVDGRTMLLCAISVVIAVAAGAIARLLTALIGLVTNVSYYGRFSFAFSSPANHRLGIAAVAVPVIGGLIVGLMARYGSRAIRGHGIPEAMEQVLVNESRIPPRITILKPLSAAVAIGTGGPFGAEGPIIATGGALGSFLGQLLHTTAMERKILLVAGATAGMTATFGSPVAAVLLGMELLLFEFRLRSLIPVAFACATAAAMRIALVGSAPVFAMPHIAPQSGAATLFYTSLGAVIGVVAVGVTRLVYAVEDAFERLPIHWAWWPALGGLVVGLVGLLSPHTLGVGYDNIERIVTGTLTGRAVLLLCVLKFVSWSIALGSGTSGGTLAPLFTIGGALGAFIGEVIAHAFPGWGIDPRVAALVSMAAIFAGASRAFLTSVVFAFETTLQPACLLPLLSGCAASCLVSSFMMRTTIMTEKIIRRGVRVPDEYTADYLDLIHAGVAGSRNVVTLCATDTVAEVRRHLHDGSAASHQGYPVVSPEGRLLGVVTRRDVLAATESDTAPVASLIKRPPVVAYADSSLREAADHMLDAGVGRLPIVSRDNPHKVIGILTRSDLLRAHARRLREQRDTERHINLNRNRTGGREEA